MKVFLVYDTDYENFLSVEGTYKQAIEKIKEVEREEIWNSTFLDLVENKLPDGVTLISTWRFPDDPDALYRLEPHYRIEEQELETED